MADHAIVVIGTSAGGIPALQQIVSAFHDGLRAAVFVVLHTTEGNVGWLPRLLNKVSRVPALYAIDDMPTAPGRIYLAPPGKHLLVESGRMCLSVGPRENRHRPSADVLFRSAASAYGARVIGVIATGYLDDGASGLTAIKARGGTAIVQDPEDAVAPGMPRNALLATEVDYVLPLQEIGPKLVDLVMNNEFQSKRGPQPVRAKETVQKTHARFGCPECGGALNEVEENGIQRFRCRVGHTYSPESLYHDQSEAVERALWAAIRTLEEHAEYSTRLAEKWLARDSHALAERFSQRATSRREHAGVLRDLLQDTEESSEIVEEAGEESTKRTGNQGGIAQLTSRNHSNPRAP